MKRFSSPETLAALVYPPQEKKNPKKNFLCSADFQQMLDSLDEEESAEECGGQGAEKKRRLSFDQVKALEKVFEVDNKLEPEQKEKIAQELGLQPKQVAIWFQNRRARWKTKQLERDYGVLKANYEALKLNYHRLEKDREACVAELKELRAKLGKENTDSSNQSFKEEALIMEAEHYNVSEQSKLSLSANNGSSVLNKASYVGLSESDHHRHQNAQPAASSSLTHESSSMYPPWMSCYQFLDSRAVSVESIPRQFMKMEEQSLFSAEDCPFTAGAIEAHWFYDNYVNPQENKG